MISSSVKEAWQINTKINRKLLEHLSTEMLSAQTPGGGFTVAQHIAEFVSTPKHWGMKFAEDALTPLPNLYEDSDTEFIAEMNLDRIRAVAQQTADTVLQAAEKSEDKGDLPHTNLDIYLVHMMAHDAHHRGQLFLALKTNGYPLPDDKLIWGPWKNE